MLYGIVNTVFDIELVILRILKAVLSFGYWIIGYWILRSQL